MFYRRWWWSGCCAHSTLGFKVVTGGERYGLIYETQDGGFIVNAAYSCSGSSKSELYEFGESDVYEVPKGIANSRRQSVVDDLLAAEIVERFRAALDFLGIRHTSVESDGIGPAACNSGDTTNVHIS